MCICQSKQQTNLQTKQSNVMYPGHCERIILVLLHVLHYLNFKFLLSLLQILHQFFFLKSVYERDCDTLLWWCTYSKMSKMSSTNFTCLLDDCKLFFPHLTFTHSYNLFFFKRNIFTIEIG